MKSGIAFEKVLKGLPKSKADFKLIEDFLSDLLNDDIRIVEVLDEKGDKQDARNTRVTLKVNNGTDNLIVIIELHYDRESNFFQRILLSTSRALIENADTSGYHLKITKVISVNILFFDPGVGEDYIYHGVMDFPGIRRNSTSHANKRRGRLAFRIDRSICPEYYLFIVNKFDDIERDPLDKWISYFKS